MSEGDYTPPLGEQIEQQYAREQERANRIDPRLPIIAQMAAVIFTEKVVYNSNREARRFAVDQAFLLFGEVSVRLRGAGQ